MPRKLESDEPTARITVLIYQSDAEMLRAVHNRFGYNKVVRQLVRNYCKSLEKRIKLEEITSDDIE